MLYIKNVPVWERLLRVLAGLAIAAVAYYSFVMSTTGIILELSAAFTAMTGFIGFCPMCALVGRKISKE